MKRRSATAALAAFAFLGAAEGAEPPQTAPSDALADLRAPGQGGRRSEPVFPVELVLEALRQSRGLSFIFDSRLLTGKSIRAVDRSRRPEADLAEELGAVSLRLHKVSSKTYAITEASRAPGAAAEISNIEPAPPKTATDTILVMGVSTTPATTGSKRIFSIDADDLAYLSLTNPAEAIYDLPQSLASFTPSNTALFAAAAGISLADLRGLYPKRTLVLVNGRRRTLTAGGIADVGGVDLSSIAEPFLERIEVQSLPGGARFGSAAVAGTINFVTRSTLDGLEAGARLGISERGDSEEISLHAIGGRTFGDFGNLTIGLNVIRNEGLVGVDREFSATPYGFGLNGVRGLFPGAEFSPGYGGSSITDRGSIGGVVLADGSFAAFPGNRSYVPEADGTLSPFIGALDQLFNWAAWQSVTLPSDRIIGQLSYNTDLADSARVSFDMHGGVAATDNLLAPLPGTRVRGVNPVAGDAAIVPLSNPFVPQSVRDFAFATFGPSASAVVFDHRYVELGPRRQQVDRRFFDLSTGVELGDKDARRVAISYRYGRTRTTSREQDRVYVNKLDIALDPAECAATPGCSPVDFFTTPEISRAALDFIAIPEISRTLTIEEHEAVANVYAPLYFGGGRVGRATAGVEFRRARFTDRDMTPAGSAPIAYLGGVDTDGTLATIDGRAEIEAELFKSSGFPGEIDGSLAARVTHAKAFDVATNFEAGLDWRPAPGIAFFARRNIGERTPDLIEMFSTGPLLETSFIDPCGDANIKSAVVAANCASSGPLGVGAGFVQTAPLAGFTSYGNPDLKPERIRSGAYGLTVTPTDLFDRLPGRMQATATWLDFDVADAIFDSADSLGACYSSPNFSSPACGVNPRTGAPIIVRDPATRQIVSVDDILTNDGGLSWRGLDLELRYSVDPDFLAFADSVWLSVLHTYVERVEKTAAGGEITRLDGLVSFPRHRTLASAGLDAGRWSFVAFANRRGKARTARSDFPEAEVSPALYLDATTRFDVSDKAYIQASVQNITDKKPVITAFNDVGNFAPEFYDPVGRRYAISLRVNF